MTFLIENFLLFLFCNILLLHTFFDFIPFLCVLISFSLICFKIAFINQKISLFLDLFTLVAALFQPLLLLEFPAIFYCNFYKKNYYICFPTLLLLIFHYPFPFSAFEIYYILLLLFSCYFAYLSAQKDELKITIRKLRDNSIEHELILKEKNQKLIEKQTDERTIAILEERNRIAREIHDHVGHMLSRSILQVAAMKAICKDENLKPHLENLNHSLNEAMNNIRNSVHDLHDEAISLEDAIHAILSEYHFCKVDFNYQIHSKLSKEIKYHFLAIIKEALNNTMKHSNATLIQLSLKEHHSFYQLLIQDNGTMISSKQNSQEGIGLRSMKERIDSIHGIIHINNENGMRIFVSVPK